jgi:hypothetical protein
MLFSVVSQRRFVPASLQSVDTFTVIQNQRLRLTPATICLNFFTANTPLSPRLPDPPWPCLRRLTSSFTFEELNTRVSCDYHDVFINEHLYLNTRVLALTCADIFFNQPHIFMCTCGFSW